MKGRVLCGEPEGRYLFASFGDGIRACARGVGRAGLERITWEQTWIALSETADGHESRDDGKDFHMVKFHGFMTSLADGGGREHESGRGDAGAGDGNRCSPVKMSVAEHGWQVWLFLPAKHVIRLLVNAFITCTRRIGTSQRS